MNSRVLRVRFRMEGGRTARKETAVRSRDAHISSRSDRLCDRPPVLDAEEVGGWGTKSRSRPATAIAKMAYEILVWVLILPNMI